MYDAELLSLDGGGIKCLIQGVLLKQLSHDFDFISGTSGGAINACLLALGYTADDIIEFYAGDCGKKIFKPYTIPITLNPFNKFMHDSTYDESNINSVLLAKMGNAKLKDIKKNIFITAYDIKSRKVLLFTNLDAEYSDLYLRDIARASSAAPLYFTPHEFVNYRCIDGGLTRNNPSVLVYSKLKKKYGYSNILEVSIGAGSFEEPIAVKDMCISNPAAFVGNLIDCFMDGSADATDAEATDIIQQDYIRFQLALTAATSKLDNVDSKNIQALTDLANNAINNDWKDNIILVKNIFNS